MAHPTLDGTWFINGRTVFAVSLFGCPTMEHRFVHDYFFVVHFRFGLFNAGPVLLVHRSKKVVFADVPTHGVGRKKCHYGVRVGRKWISAMVAGCVHFSLFQYNQQTNSKCPIEKY